jgi:DNA-binding PadR family transcriptional regulator
MNLKKERELIVFTYLLEMGLRPVTEIQAELALTGDEDFPFENTLNDLVKEGYLEPKSADIITDQPEVLSWEITEKGRMHMKDLAQEKYEEKNKIPVVIWAVIFVIAILTFMKLFPRMFH